MIEKIIGFIGAGQMARALAAGFVKSELISDSRIMTCDAVPAAADQFQDAIGAKARICGANPELIAAADVIFLAVKPQHVKQVMAESRGAFDDDKLLVSIAAGITIDQLSSGFATDRVIRVMPNTPCLVGQGASGFSTGAAASEEDAAMIESLLASVGVAVRLEERLLDAVTGLSGSGPAFVFMLIEAMSDGGVRMGLPRMTATTLAAQTVLGAAHMVQQCGQHPAELKDRVASPGGTTIAGLQALEDRGLRAAVIAAVQAATEKSIELGAK